jgi:hypothetical protein
LPFGLAQSSRHRTLLTITGTLPGLVTVDHQGGIDGVDTLRNIERLLFLGDPVIVPNLRGMTQAQAVLALRDVGLVVGPITFETSLDVAENLIIRSSPAAGQTVVAGTAIGLVIRTALPACSSCSTATQSAPKTRPSRTALCGAPSV